MMGPTAHKQLQGYLSGLMESQFFSRQRLLDIQNQKIARLLAHAYEHCAYYRRVFDKFGFDYRKYRDSRDLRNIPVLTKADIRNNLAEMADGSRCSVDQFGSDQCADSFVHSISGGTTGPSIDIFNDERSMLEKQCVQMRFDAWSGWEIGEWMGLIWPAVVESQKGKQGLQSKIKNYLGARTISLQQTVIDEGDFSGFFDKVRHRKAVAIRGFPFQVAEAAAYCKSKQIHFEHLKGIVTTGEPLYPDQRELIEAVFGCPVFDSYRTREAGCLAQECELHDGLHISAETVYVETLPNDKNEYGPEGGAQESEGKILVTDLTNFAVPLIRYEIGDIGTLSDRSCQCGRGSPLIDHIGGRISDMLYTPEGKRVPPVTLIPNLFHLIGIMNQFRIIQDRLDHLTIQMVKPAPHKGLLDRQQENIRRIFGQNTKTTYEYVDRIEPLRSGKYAFVVSKIDKSHLPIPLPSARLQ
jgi:phenylacetate-CoA ligase